MTQLTHQLGRKSLKSHKIPLKPGGTQGGFGGSSLKECIELLNATVRNSPAPLDSGVGQETTVPSQPLSLPAPKVFLERANGA